MESTHAVYRRIAPGTYTLSVGSKGFQVDHRRVEIHAGVNTFRFQLKPAPGRQKKEEKGAPALRGVVLDAMTRRPIANVRVTAGRIKGQSDAEGRYVLRNLPKGKYRLQVSRDGYGFTVLRDVEVYGDRVRMLDIELEPAAKLRLTVTDSAGRPVTGRIFLSIRPLERGRGTRVGTSVTADGEGLASYRQIVPGRYTLYFKADERGQATEEVEILPGENRVDVTLEPLPEPGR